MKIKVGVIFGGETVEHEVSIISAVQAMESINTDKYDIVPIYVTKDRRWFTGNMLKDIAIYKDMDLLKRYAKEVVLYKKGDQFVLQNQKGFKGIINTIDVAFPIVHGQNVEDGTLAGYLDTIGIPYVGPGVLGAALGQDKVVMKQVFEASKLPIVSYTWFYDKEYTNNSEDILKNIKKLGYPVIVKPARLGSSVGISVAKNESEVDKCIMDAINYDEKIVVEKVVENMVEVNCSVLGNYEYQEASVLEEVCSAKDFLTYQEKYLQGGKGKTGSKGMASASRIIPARIDDKMTEAIKESAKEAFRVLNLSGVCRIDYMIDKKNNKFYINEPNTIPGSLSFYLWDPTGKDYTTLLDELISLAIRNYKIKSKKIYTFDSNILSNYGVKGMKGKLGVKK